MNELNDKTRSRLRKWRRRRKQFLIRKKANDIESHEFKETALSVMVIIVGIVQILDDIFCISLDVNDFWKDMNLYNLPHQVGQTVLFSLG